MEITVAVATRDSLDQEVWQGVNHQLQGLNDLEKLSKALRWAQEGQVVRVTFDPR